VCVRERKRDCVCVTEATPSTEKESNVIRLFVCVCMREKEIVCVCY